MTVQVGDSIPPFVVSSVDAGRMKTMAALLQDPYPIHWDPEATAALGLGNRLINQGPLSLGYVTNMLMNWQGNECVRRLTASFRAPVFEGETVTAGGAVTEIVEVDGERRARCDVWLDGPERRAIIGTADVALLEQQQRS